jgi:hypothetical protein
MGRRGLQNTLADAGMVKREEVDYRAGVDDDRVIVMMLTSDTVKPW